MESATNFVKIVYFDESFVSDYFQISSGGEMKRTVEVLQKFSAAANADASLEAEIGKQPKTLAGFLSLLSGISIKAGGKASGEIEKQTEKMTKSVIENTLLADFVDLISGDNEKTGIKVFSKIPVRPEKNTFTFFMLMAPYINMMDGKVALSESDNVPLQIDVTKIGDAIEQGRGYYEFIGIDGNQEVILRFNISAFRNHYTMSDLPKMALTYYAVHVGTIDKQQLQIEREFDFGSKAVPKRLSYIDDSKQDENKTKSLEVYDVILAGVMRE